MKIVKPLPLRGSEHLGGWDDERNGTGGSARDATGRNGAGEGEEGGSGMNEEDGRDGVEAGGRSGEGCMEDGNLGGENASVRR